MTASNNSSSPLTTKSWRPWRLGLSVLLALFLVVSLSLWLLLPRWIKSSGAELAGQTLGRAVSIGAVSFNPWRLGLTLEDVVLAGQPPQKEALFELGKLELNLSLSSIWLRTPVVESLTIERPTLRVARLTEGHYDIDDLLARFLKPKAEAQPDAKPFALAIYNISLSQGTLIFDDRPADRRHQLSELVLDLPFLSTLAADVKIYVQPQLAGRLNGVVFGAKGQALPFADQRVATLDFKLDDLDLATFAPYAPATLPLQLKQGRLDANVNLKFQQSGKKVPELALSGQIQLSNFALQAPASEPGLAWRELNVQLLDVQPLRQVVKLGEVSLRAPKVSASRDGRGVLNLAGIAQEAKAGGREGARAAQGKAAQGKAAEGKASGFALSMARFDLSDGEIAWSDASTRPRANLIAEAIEVGVSNVNWPLKSATPIKLALRLRPQGQLGAMKPASLDGSGSLSPEALSFDWTLQALDLQWLTPYLQAHAPLRLAGLVASKGGLLLERPLDAAPGQRANLKLVDLQLDALSLAGKHAREPLLKMASMSLDSVEANPGARKLTAGTLTLKRPALDVARAKDGQWSFAQLQPQAHAGVARESGSAAEAAPWALQLKGLKLEQGSMRVLDAATPAEPLALNLEQIAVDVKGLAWPAQAKPMPVNLSLKLGAAKRGVASKGLVQWQGAASLAPRGASGSLRLERVPLHLLNAYLDPAWGLHLKNAELGVRGQFNARLMPEGLEAQVTGKILLADMLAHQYRQIEGQWQIGEELLSWQALNLDGVKFNVKPGSPGALSIADVMLDDFFARVIINEQGTVNLRDLGPVDRTAAKPVAAVSAAAPPASASANSPSKAMPISIGQIRVAKGRVDFNDRFVRPNYSARLSELQGSLGAFSSERAEMAPLSLRGRVAGTGQLDVGGQVNPLGKPVLLDIRASATDIELAPLSAYAAKYVGYAIERGKFSTKVQYKVDPGGALQANNQIILNQLTFGEQVESPEATKLPVLFAVALLKDKHGVIDVEVPIKGSINEPEFSVGGIIWKVIGNLLGRALSAPFSLFSGGDGADLSRLEFLPGGVQAAAPGALDSVAKMMDERPGLSLTIKGWADPVSERKALQERQLEDALMAERQRELQRQQTASASQQAAAGLSLTESDRARLLKPVYQAAKLPNKPKNMIGFAKDIPAPEMRALLLASYQVSDDKVRALALERGVVVRDALIAKGLANSRIFLGAPGLHDGADEAGKAWVPHAELQLSAQ